MNFQMGFQTAVLSESLITDFTFERLFSTVNFQMSFQITLFSESLITDFTFERFVFHVLRCTFFTVLRIVELNSLAFASLKFVRSLKKY